MKQVREELGISLESDCTTMSTQNSGFSPVPFSATYPQQSFRLLELPPELVLLIERQDEKNAR